MIADPEGALWAVQCLQGRKITLRRFREADAAAVYAYGSDAETVSQVKWDGVKTPEEALASVRDFFLVKSGAFAIALPSDLCIGAIDLRPELPHEKAGFGYILNRAYWNRGYMSEALGLLLNYAFSVLELNRVESHHYADNPASGRVMEKCGMRREGLMRQECKIKGIFRDCVHYGILREEWARGREP